MVKPCLTCKKYERQEECEYKACREWKKWFVEKWKLFNNFYEDYLRRTGAEKTEDSSADQT